MSVQTVLPPLPPPLELASSPLRKLHRLLLWGFGVSVALHAIFGPIVGQYKPPTANAQEVSMVTLSRRITIKLPSPTPVPTPTPTKPPTPPPSPSAAPIRTALPVAVHTAPKQAHLKINVFKTTSRASASSQDAYHSQPGSEAGVPPGTLASAPAQTPAEPVAVGSPASAVTPASARTSPPACAVPNTEAQITNMGELVYPDFAG